MLVLTVLGCSPPPTPESSRIYVRLSEDVAAPLEDALWKKTDQAPVFTWRFETPEDLEPWQLTGRSRLEGRNGALPITLAKKPVRLTRAVDLEAAAIDGFRLELEGVEKLEVRCFWSREEEKLSAERMVLIATGDLQTGLLLDLSGHPLWADRITRLRFDLIVPGPGIVRLEQISGIHSEVSASGLATALSRPWRVDLSSEVRSALIALPGVAIERELEVPPSARLRFAFGIESNTSAPITFHVRVRDAQSGSHDLFQSTLDARAVEPAAGVWHEKTVDLHRFHGQKIHLALITETEGPFDPLPGLPFWATPEILAAAPDPAPLNVILISIDTLRADRLSLYGYRRKTTAHLDAWAMRRAVVFENVVAPAPWTLPSHASMFSGLDALSHGLNHNHPAPAGLTTLAEILRDNGYRTLAVTGGGGWMGPKYGLDQGFDVYRHWEYTARDADKELEHGISASLERLEELSSEPFFLFLHTFEVHGPYVPREPYFSRFQGAPPAPESSPMILEQPIHPTAADGFALRKQFYHFDSTGKGHPTPGDPLRQEDRPLLDSLYDSAVAYADAQLARLLEHLESSGLAERTLVVITSDHGEALGEKGLASHAYLYDFNLLVPLIFAIPGEAMQRIEEQVRVIDIVPSVLDLLGISPPSPMDGVSLLPLIRNRARATPQPAWTYAGSSNFGVALRLSNKLKYIYNDTAWAPANGRQELYDLRLDSGEEDSLAASSGEVETLRQQVRERLAKVDHGIRIDFENARRRGYSGTLEGSSIYAFKVKSPALPTGALEFRDDVKNARFRVGPDESYSLFVAWPASSTLQIAIEDLPGEAPGFATTLDLAELEGSFYLVLQERGWRKLSSAPQSSPAASIVITRLGSVPSVREDPAVTDSRLRDQLRALGYVDG